MTRRDVLIGAGSGVLAALAGLAAGHLTAAVVSPAASPVLAVGTAVINRTPTPVKEWAVGTFGTADKPILIGSVALVTLALAAVGGVLARRRFALGAVIVLVLVAAAAAAALERPTAVPQDVFPALVTGAAALAVLRWLSPDPDSPPVDAAGRRRLLIGAAAVAAAAATAGAVGQWLIQRARDVVDIVLPSPADPLPPLPRGLDARYRGISAFQTANDDFYRIDVSLTVPVVDQDSWRLKIDGMVDHPFELTFDDLLAMPMTEADVTLTCVSNEVGGEYVGSARWLGVRVSDLLERAGVRSGADQILSTAVDGFTVSTPLAAATDGRDMLVAVAMNGVPLPRLHGFPARLVTPGLYGYVGATKWLERLTLTTYADAEAYWTERGWATEGPIKVSSRVDTPRGSVDAGRIVVGGVAWAQHDGIASVEVQVDDGPWMPAELGPDAGIDYWRQWYWVWDAEPGNHRVASRATTVSGIVQTAERARPFPDGSTGIMRIAVQVD